jgi:hypothetical protein
MEANTWDFTNTNGISKNIISLKYPSGACPERQ